MDYYKATLDGFALDWAKELQEIQDSLFWDDQNGAYFYSKANSPNVIIRLKDGKKIFFNCIHTEISRHIDTGRIQQGKYL